MNFRGSLAYYPAAVVCGSFFLAVSYYPYFVVAHNAPRHEMARDFLFTFFFTAILALFDLVVTAFLLRLLARRMGWARAWQWLVAGMVTFLLVTTVLGGLGVLVERGRSILWLRTPLMFLLMGPRFGLKQPLWLALPPMAATSYVLFLIHRAFEPRLETPPV
jgi:hypothetical protein